MVSRLPFHNASAGRFPVVIIIVSLLWSMCSKAEGVTYSYLTQYEGVYEFGEAATLDIVASDFDHTLYAIIDSARYPLTFVDGDSFINVQGTPVLFFRDNSNQIAGFQVHNQSYSLIRREVDRPEFFPRRDLYNQPENYQYHPPKHINDDLSVGNIKQHFAHPERLTDMVKATIQGDYPGVHSILIFKDGKLLLEEYFYGYDAGKAHQLRSATKTFIGTLTGIALKTGIIKSTEQKVLPFFADTYADVKHLTEAKGQLTIEHLLRYRHGLACENNDPQSPGNEASMMQSDDWVKFTLDLPVVAAPGDSSSYCSGTPLVLAQLIALASQTPIESFARQHLFSPLGITHYQWRFAPDRSSENTFNQMYLRPRDLLKLASLYLNNGIWKSQQIISAQWVARSFTSEPGDFGYMWKHRYFKVNGQQHDSFMASGNGGQKVNVWPEHNMITVFTGGNYNSYLLYGKSTPPNEMIPKYILTAL